MPQDTLTIRIANSNPTPNGPAAVMSRTGDGHPNQAEFQALDKPYTITLKPGFWAGLPDGADFGLAQGEVSIRFQLDLNAPLGAQQPYTIDPPSRERVPPEIIIQP